MKKLSLFLAVILLAGCTKKLGYKEEPKFEEMDKSVVDTQSDFVYVASQLNNSYSAEDAMPYFQGTEKIVRFRLTKDAIQVVEVESDPRFRGNKANEKQVMSIPVTYVKYECVKDRYGDCTSAEGEAKDVDWSQRDRIKPDFNNVKITEVSTLPIEIDKFLGNPCFETQSARFTGGNWDSNGLNFSLEKTISVKALPECKAKKLSDHTMTVNYRYSIMKRNSLISKNYKPVSYESEDENTFGFFTSRIQNPGVDFRNTLDTVKTYMNRWNPNRKEIVYYLSPEFNKPENAILKKATYATIEKLNQGLKDANVNFNVRINDKDEALPGDITKSMLILIDDPAAASLLGYGPSVADPLTGEIISARVVMYAGTLRLSARGVYEEMRDRLHEKRLTQQQGPLAPAPEQSKGQPTKASLINPSLLSGLRSDWVSAAPGIAKVADTAFAGAVKNQTSLVSNQNFKSLLTNYTAYSDEKTMDPIEKFFKDSHQCRFSVDHLDFAKIVANVLEKERKGELPPWEELSAKEREDALNLIMPEIYVPVLLHELGHNMGLRHNFKGSEDKDNFYTMEELKQRGVNHMVPQSTVMEYTSSEVSALPTLGKYDIAALRFGYLRKIQVEQRDPKSNQVLKTEEVDLTQTVEEQTADGKTKPVVKDVTVAELKQILSKKAPGLDIKPYGYCTDEHVGLNAGCKRFDQGTTNVEMAQNMIKAYHDMYRMRNFRHDNLNFSIADDAAYAQRISGVFLNLRLFLEVYERISMAMHLSPTDDIWKKDAYAKDLREAVVLSGKFFLDVLTTPNASCIYSEAQGQGQQQQPGPLRIFNLDSTAPVLNCDDFDQAKLAKQGVTMIGQIGKSFASRKDPNADHAMSHYADQIDVRGIWADKILAAKMLLGRTIGTVNDPSTLDAGHMNYYHIPELRQEITEVLAGIMANSISKPVEIRTLDGDVGMIKASYDLFDTQVIPQHLIPEVGSALGLPNRELHLQEIVANQILKESSIAKKEHIDDPLDRRKVFGVYKLNLLESKLYPDPNKVVVNDYAYMFQGENPVAGALIKQMQIAQKLEKVKPEALEKIIDARQKKQTMPQNATAEEKAVWTLPEDDLKLVLTGQIKNSKFYEQALDMLPTLNDVPDQK